MRFLGNKTISAILKYLTLGILIAYCISLLLPLTWMVYTAFKPTIEYFENSFTLPSKLEFSNFYTAASALKIEVISPTKGKLLYEFWDMVEVSFIWALGVPFVAEFYTMITAYVISKYRFAGGQFIYMLGIFIMVVPILGATPSLMAIKRQINMYDNLFMHFVAAPGYCFTGLQFLLFYAAWKAIPWDYAEAAFIDGAGHWKVLVKIMIPMLVPTFSALYLLAVLSWWNDYGTFMIWLPSYVNLAYGLYLFQNDASKYGAAMPQIMAGFIICMAPTVIIYVSSQRFVQSKLMVGGLKG